MVAKRVTVYGRVQSVSFRAFVKEQADKLGLDGFVRNRKEGTVEALIIGEPDAVDKMIQHCHKGSMLSKVERVDVQDAQDIADKGFKQLPTV